MPRRRRNNLHRGIAGSTAILAIGGLMAATQAMGAAPPAPTNSDSVTQKFNSAAAAVAIPDAAGVPVSQSLTVSGAKSFLRDVDARTSILNRNWGDVDVTLTHETPAGASKTITLVGSPGATGRTSNNVLSDITFDDQGSTVITNVTIFGDDRLDAIASAVPEEKLAAFVGMDPNGKWTITVKRVRAAAVPGGGTDVLQSFGVDVTSHTQSAARVLPESPLNVTVNTPTQITNATDGGIAPPVPPAVVGTPLPDTKATTTIPLTVPAQAGVISDLKVRIKLAGDMEDHPTMTLVSPNGTSVSIAGADGYKIPAVTPIFNTMANSVISDTGSELLARTTWLNNVNKTELQGEDALGKFLGQSPTGTWKLVIDDVYNDGEAPSVLQGWALEMKVTSGFGATPPPTPGGGNVISPPPAQGGGGGGGGGGAGATTVTVTNETQCLPAAPAAKVARISVANNGTSFAKIRQGVGTAQQRAAAIESWLRQGIASGDLCGGAFAARDLSVLSGPAASVQRIASPSPRNVPAPTAKLVKKNGSVSLSEARRLSTGARAALRQALALQSRVNGRLTGGDLRDGAVTPAQLSPGLTVTSRTGATAAASATNVAIIVVKATPKNAPIVKHLRDAEAYSRQATSILNAIRAKLGAGLAGDAFQDGSIGASKIA